MSVVMEAFTRNDMGEAFIKSPLGARGDEDVGCVVCYICDTQRQYSLNPVSLAVILGPENEGGFNKYGIGGDELTVWLMQKDVEGDTHIHKLFPFDLRVERTSPDVGGFATFGVGGTADTIWSCDFGPGHLYQRSTVNFSVISEFNPPDYTDPDGIGGSADRIWFCDSATDFVYELQPPTGIPAAWKELQKVAAPGVDIEGMGGGDDCVWLVHRVASEIYELVPDTLAVKRGPIASPTVAQPWGIGGK